jgi:hypothetical protein
MVEVWDRVLFQKLFQNGEAVTWLRSYDLGRTWEPVVWYGPRLPFVQRMPISPVKTVVVQATKTPILMLPEHVK